MKKTIFGFEKIEPLSLTSKSTVKEVDGLKIRVLINEGMNLSTAQELIAFKALLNRRR